jgi:hypothetical protein
MSASAQVIFDFDKSSNIQSWQITDDRVMGGISQSYFELTKEGYGKFHGYVTTESNGGFSSVDHNMKVLGVDPSHVIKLKVKGDGKTYQFRVKANNNDRYNYIKEFKTNGDWQNLEIKLSDMVPSFRGRKLDMPNFDENQISGITILIGNGKKQNFELLVDCIEVVAP